MQSKTKKGELSDELCAMFGVSDNIDALERCIKEQSVPLPSRDYYKVRIWAAREMLDHLHSKDPVSVCIRQGGLIPFGETGELDILAYHPITGDVYISGHDGRTINSYYRLKEFLDEIPNHSDCLWMYPPDACEQVSLCGGPQVPRGQPSFESLLAEFDRLSSWGKAQADYDLTNDWGRSGDILAIAKAPYRGYRSVACLFWGRRLHLIEPDGHFADILCEGMMRSKFHDDFGHPAFPGLAFSYGAKIFECGHSALPALLRTLECRERLCYSEYFAFPEAADLDYTVRDLAAAYIAHILNEKINWKAGMPKRDRELQIDRLIKDHLRGEMKR